MKKVNDFLFSMVLNYMSLKMQTISAFPILRSKQIIVNSEEFEKEANKKNKLKLFIYNAKTTLQKGSLVNFTWSLGLLIAGVSLIIISMLSYYSILLRVVIVFSHLAIIGILTYFLKIRQTKNYLFEDRQNESKSGTFKNFLAMEIDKYIVIAAIIIAILNLFIYIAWIN